ncbi:hypothetical protein MMAGJ_22530 [Mycolicibacterium mageritense]|uniref:Uncharacterized protein n=1 Tax=Mycolicibacterium mageritense TaxID=53462 RepID=A0ABM7HR01_MYCME|nr:hypothetical protein MMAGJ_22530 [Mycolicibacterium mageritense]
MTVRRVELTDQDSRSEPKLGSQRGSLPAPSVDVFGSWLVTAASTNLWGPLGDAVPIATPDLQQQCFDHMPDDAAVRKSMYSGFQDNPPAHGDPIPGWPEV